MSACSATRSFSDEPMPWPAVAVVRSKIGRPELVAACKRAVILRECAGFTRPSFSPHGNKTAGYAVPSLT